MSDPSSAPSPGEVYEHWKGGFYRVLFLALDEATKETVVVYVGVLGDRWVRTLSSWEEDVETESGRRPRFRRDSAR